MTYNPWSTPQLKDLFRRELAIRLLEKQVAPAPDWAAISRQEFTLLKELSSSGVPVFAGTDLGSLLIYPGFSLHDELQGLVEQVGLTPAEALRGATFAPAQFFRAADWGRIAVGQRADIVLLDGNPLENIRVTRRIRGVVLDGTYNHSAPHTLLRSGANPRRLRGPAGRGESVARVQMFGTATCQPVKTASTISGGHDARVVQSPTPLLGYRVCFRTRL
jgi:Amidohydrolase family